MKIRPVHAALAALLLCACSLPAARRGGAAPSPGGKASPEVELRAEQLYYKAVAAYGDNDMAVAGKYLDEISSIYPGYAPAAELRAKIRRVAAPAGGGGAR